MLRKLMIEDFVDEYHAHDARVYDLNYNVIEKTLSFKFEHVYDITDKNKPCTLVQLDVLVHGVQNFNMCQDNSIYKTKKLGEIDESLYGIYLDGKTCTTIVFRETDRENDLDGETVIKFVAEKIEVEETKIKLKNLEEYYEKYDTRNYDK